MKKLLPLLLLATACAHDPNKAEKLELRMTTFEPMSQETGIGIHDGNMVYRQKVSMVEELRRLQNEVYSLEDRVYGNRKFGSLGLYGMLKACRFEMAKPTNGGDGKLAYTEPLDRITDKEEDFKVGTDEHDKIVGLSEEFLLDRITRFKEYKKMLQKRQDEYEEKVDICRVASNGQE